MSDIPPTLYAPPADFDLGDLVPRVRATLAHLWMVRTFVKHSEEAEEYPDLLLYARVAFDVARAVETRLDDPAALLRMLRKKTGKLRRATDGLARDAAEASLHTNWEQAVLSARACLAELEALLAAGEAALSGGLGAAAG